MYDARLNMKPLIFLLLVSFAAPSFAHEQVDHYDRVHLSAAAQARVENDIAIATFYAQEEGSDAADLANRVNTRINEAVELIKQHDAMKMQTSVTADQHGVVQQIHVHTGTQVENGDLLMTVDPDDG